MKRSIKTLILISIFWILGILIIRVNFTLFSSLFTLHSVSKSISSYYCTMLIQLFIVLEIFSLIFVLAIKAGNENFQSIGFGAMKIKHMGYGVVVGFTAALCAWFFYIYYNRVPFAFAFAFHDVGKISSVFIPWALANLFEAVYEEIMFRGWFLVYFRKLFGEKSAILSGGFIFGVMHLFNPHYSLFGVLNAVIIGMILSFIFFRTGAIWVTISLHFAWNFTLELLNSPLFVKYTTLNHAAYQYISNLESTPSTFFVILAMLFGTIFYRYFFEKKESST